MLSMLEQTGPIVFTVTSALVLYTRSVGVAYSAAGCGFCALSVKVIKRFIRQPRPILGTQKGSYGMPSTHSASISYLATYILLASLYLPVHASLDSVVNVRLVPFVAVSSAAIVTMSRVWLGHHTWPQVFAGVSYGIGLALFWFQMWRSGLNDRLTYAETIVNSWI